MRILHVSPYYFPAVGGAETYLKEISERLAQRGHEVTVLTMNNRGASDASRLPLADLEVVNDVNVVRFRPADRLQHLFNTLLRVRGAHRSLGAVIGLDKVQMLAIGPYSLRPFREIVRSRPDVVAVSNWYCSLFPYQLCRARRRGDFALVGIPFFHTERYWSQAALYGPMLDRCDAIVTMTEHERRFISQRSKTDRAHVVGAGVDPKAFADAAGGEIRSRHGIGDAPLVGYVGRMTALKGVATLVQAMTIVWQTDPAVRLLLAGSGLATGGSPQDEVTQALARLSPAERSRIVIIGAFSDQEKASLFDALDLFAMPSVAESFGIAYLEAWMRKKAVIGSRIGSTECVIDDGVDGVLVAPEKPEDLARAILRLMADRRTREQMGSAGYSKTITHFTWEKIADKVEGIYQREHLAGRRLPQAG